MTSACSITTQDLSVRFSDELVLDRLDLCCEPGAFVAVVGPSGCGKSTLLRCLAGLQAPTGGAVQVETDASVDPRIAYVFQDANLLPWRSVERNISLPLELQAVPAANRRDTARSLMRQVGLSAADARKRPSMLSGGMQMRVSLGRALSTDPNLLLLDEPFGAIDDLARQRLNELLLELWRTQRWTAVLVTHNVSEAVYLSQRVLVMTPRPARILGDVSIPFGLDRDASLRARPEFAALVEQVARQLRQAAEGIEHDA